MKKKKVSEGQGPRKAFSFFRKILTYIFPKMLEIRSGDLTSLLIVKMVNGKLLLDTTRVNYSFGGLHVLFERLFKKIEFQHESPNKILILGYGVGSVANILRNDYGLTSHITAVELDTIVIELGGRFFNTGQNENFRLYNMDAAEYVKSSRETFDLIVVDVFVESFVPESVRTQEFIERLHQIMNTNALLIFNYMIYNKKSKENFQILENNFKVIFEDFKVIAMNETMNDNHVLIARKK